MKSKSSLHPSLILASSLLACVTTLQAQTIWTGAVDNDWHKVGNWSSGLPGAGNIPEIRNAGNVVNLTQNVTIGGSGGFALVQARNGTGAPATLNISANLDLGTNGFEVGSRFGAHPATGYYQGVVNQTSGVVTAGYLRLALRGGTLGAPPSEYNMSGGTLNVSQLHVSAGSAVSTAAGTFRQTGGEVNVGGNLWLSQQQGRGVYLMEDGALNVTGGTFLIAERSTTNPTFHQTGGTVSMSNMGVSRIAWRDATSGSATGTMILEGGSFSFASNNSYFAVSERTSGVVGTLVKYGAADVSFSTTSATTDPALQMTRDGSTGTLRAVIDQTGFDAIKLNSAGVAFNYWGSSTLQIALAGGVMMSGSNTVQIIDNQTGTVTGTWQNGPSALWNATTSTAVGVRAVLNSALDGGSLDASTYGNTINLATASSLGYIDLANASAVNPFLLRLGLDSASVGATNLDDFIFDLAAAGYSPMAFGAYGVDITFDPVLNGSDYFAWDLSEYTNSSTLQIESITVIPESSAALLGGIGLLMLLRRRRP